jgi:hypothetical protein
MRTSRYADPTMPPLVPDLTTVDRTIAEELAWQFFDDLGAGRCERWSKLVPVDALMSFDQPRRWCTIEGEYLWTGHPETHPAFARRMFLSARADLRQGTRYRVEGVAGTGSVGGLSSRPARKMVAISIEALSAGVARAFGDRRLHARRCEAAPIAADPAFAPLDVLVGVAGELRVAAALWFDAPNRAIARAQDLCRARWTAMFGDEQAPSLFTVVNRVDRVNPAGVLPRRARVILPTEPGAALQVIRAQLAEAACTGADPSLVLHATLVAEHAGAVLVVRDGGGSFTLDEDARPVGGDTSTRPPLVVIAAGQPTVAEAHDPVLHARGPWQVRFGEGTGANEMTCASPSAATTATTANRIEEDRPLRAGAAATHRMALVVHGESAEGGDAWLPARLAARSLGARLGGEDEPIEYVGAADRLPIRWGHAGQGDISAALTRFSEWSEMVDRSPLRATRAGAERAFLELDTALRGTDYVGAPIRHSRTSCTFARLERDHLWGVHSGIGRALRFARRTRTLEVLTCEHYLDLLLRRRGDVTPDLPPQILVGALGFGTAEHAQQPERFECSFEPGDVAILCSERFAISDDALRDLIDAAPAGSVAEVSVAIDHALGRASQRDIAWALLLGPSA